MELNKALPPAVLLFAHRLKREYAYSWLLNHARFPAEPVLVKDAVLNIPSDENIDDQPEDSVEQQRYDIELCGDAVTFRYPENVGSTAEAKYKLTRGYALYIEREYSGAALNNIPLEDRIYTSYISSDGARAAFKIAIHKALDAVADDYAFGEEAKEDRLATKLEQVLYTLFSTLWTMHILDEGTFAKELFLDAENVSLLEEEVSIGGGYSLRFDHKEAWRSNNFWSTEISLYHNTHTVVWHSHSLELLPGLQGLFNATIAQSGLPDIKAAVETTNMLIEIIQMLSEMSPKHAYLHGFEYVILRQAIKEALSKTFSFHQGGN